MRYCNAASFPKDRTLQAPVIFFAKNQEERLKMGTRGTYGFRYRQTDKLTYCHYDSYPSWLGARVLEFVRQTSSKEMRNIFPRLILVDDADPNGRPSLKLQKKYRKYLDGKVASGSKEDWYCLLRNAQGDLFAYKRGLRHMLDCGEFIKDSLSCEYGYVINLDTDALEFWVGWQKKPDVTSRYGTDCEEGGYYPCRMIGALPLIEARANSVNESVKIFERWAREAGGDDES
jgi:hypothetical protein